MRSRNKIPRLQGDNLHSFLSLVKRDFGPKFDICMDCRTLHRLAPSWRSRGTPDCFTKPGGDNWIFFIIYIAPQIAAQKLRRRTIVDAALLQRLGDASRNNGEDVVVEDVLSDGATYVPNAGDVRDGKTAREGSTLSGHYLHLMEEVWHNDVYDSIGVWLNDNVYDLNEVPGQGKERERIVSGVWDSSDHDSAVLPKKVDMLNDMSNNLYAKEGEVNLYWKGGVWLNQADYNLARYLNTENR